MNKKIIWIGLIANILFISSTSPLLADADIYQVTASPSLIIRDEPSVDGEKLGTIPNGEEIEILESTDNEDTINGRTGKWVRLEWDGVEGYAFDAYLDLVYKDDDNNDDTSSQVTSPTLVYTSPVTPPQSAYIPPAYPLPPPNPNMNDFDREMQETNIIIHGAMEFARANGMSATPTTVNCEDRKRRYEECEKTRDMMDSGVSKAGMNCSRWLDNC